MRVQDLTFLIDTREKLPLDICYVEKDANDGGFLRRPVRTERLKLDTGDYSIKGFHRNLITVERKNLDDLVSCCGVHRERFDREIYRLLGFKSRLIVVEASWDEILEGNWRSSMQPSKVVCSIAGWMDLGIPFFFHPDREVIAKYVGNFLFIHARRFYALAKSVDAIQREQ